MFLMAASITHVLLGEGAYALNPSPEEAASSRLKTAF